MACLRAKSIFAGDEMIRAFGLLFAAVTLLAGSDHARAQGFDMRDIMGGGPNFSLP